MRATVLRGAPPPARTAAGQSAAIQVVTPSLQVELEPTAVVRDTHEIERAVTTFAAGSNNGLVVTGSSTNSDAVPRPDRGAVGNPRPTPGGVIHFATSPPAAV